MSASIGNSGVKEPTYASIVKEPNESDGVAWCKGGWAGFTDKYWATAIVPDQAQDLRRDLLGTWARTTAKILSDRDARRADHDRRRRHRDLDHVASFRRGQGRHHP